MDKLPYGCKELINLFALNKYSDYKPLEEFNKICDYESCEYSHEKLRKAKENYIIMRNKFTILINKTIADLLDDKIVVTLGMRQHFLTPLSQEIIDYINKSNLSLDVIKNITQRLLKYNKRMYYFTNPSKYNYEYDIVFSVDKNIINFIIH